VVATDVFAETVEEKEERLKKELAEVEDQIFKQRQILHGTRQEADSIGRDIDILSAEIAEARLKIQRHEINIQRIGRDINDKTVLIGELTEEIKRDRESLAQLIRNTHKVDSYSFVEILLSNKNISEFFNDLRSYESIKDSIHTSVIEVKQNKKDNEDQKEYLGVQKNQETDAKFSVESEKKLIESKEAEKQRLLDIKNNEAQGYEQVIAERTKKAAEIRAALFALRDTAAIPFGTALTYANTAFAKTGVRPAFLLAILKQESNIGQNVGTCNRPGDPPEKSWRNIMPGPDSGSWRDDQTIFLDLTKRLGLDPDSVPLSCPLSSGGWGGAMGPAQFIPATWVSYEARVAQALGKSAVSPWNPEDAFTASALYLADLGAAAGGYTAERTAALKYYSGSNWSLPQNAFYGDGVMRHAQDIQVNMIDPLQNT